YYEGLPVNFYLDNAIENKAEVETKLSKNKEDNVIIIPQTEATFTGYGFHFIVKSIGEEKAKAEISNIGLYPFPQATIEHIRLINTFKPTTVTNPTKTNVPFSKDQPAFYTTTIPNNSSGYLILSQSFDKGWKAYTIDQNPLAKL